MIIAIYSVLTLAQTKLVNLAFGISLLFLLAGGSFLESLIEAFNWTGNLQKIYPFLLLTLVGFAFLQMPVLAYEFNPNRENNWYMKTGIINKKNAQYLNGLLPPKTVVFTGLHNIETMFYTNFTAFAPPPNEGMYQELKQLGRPIAILKLDSVPSYLQKDTGIIWVDKKMEGAKYFE